MVACQRMNLENVYVMAKHLSDVCSLLESATDKQRALVEAKAQAVLDARAKYLGSAPAPGAVADAPVGNTGNAPLATRAGKQPARARSATAGAAVLPLKVCTLPKLPEAFRTGTSKLATSLREMPKTSKNSFQNVCLSALSLEADLLSRANLTALWRISFHESGMAGD